MSEQENMLDILSQAFSPGELVRLKVLPDIELRVICYTKNGYYIVDYVDNFWVSDPEENLSIEHHYSELEPLE